MRTVLLMTTSGDVYDHTFACGDRENGSIRLWDLRNAEKQPEIVRRRYCYMSYFLLFMMHLRLRALTIRRLCKSCSKATICLPVQRTASMRDCGLQYNRIIKCLVHVYRSYYIIAMFMAPHHTPRLFSRKLITDSDDIGSCGLQSYKFVLVSFLTAHYHVSLGQETPRRRESL